MIWKLTVSSVTADTIVGHENAENDAEGAEEEKCDGERDLLNRRAIVNGVGSPHHNVLVRDGEGMVDVRHFRIRGGD
uniref:Uncharacterized protein n=1 Tax=Cannabis sativa TaxID=3483 RepID=A0A803PI77_CANSA